MILPGRSGLILLLVFACISCSAGRDWSGYYYHAEGPCSSRVIHLKKVQGFADKYYIVTLYGNPAISPEKNEYLGVIKNNKIKVDSGYIHLSEGGIVVTVSGKRCFYRKSLEADKVDNDSQK